MNSILQKILLHRWEKQELLVMAVLAILMCIKGVSEMFEPIATPLTLDSCMLVIRKAAYLAMIPVGICALVLSESLIPGLPRAGIQAILFVEVIFLFTLLGNVF